MNRLRTRGGFVTTQPRLITTNRTCGVTADEGPWGPAFNSGTYETMEDVVIPNFHARRKAGEVFFNPMKRSVWTVTGSGSPMKIGHTGAGCTAQGGITHEGTGPAFPGTVPMIPSLGIPALQVVITPQETQSLLTEVSTSLRNRRGRGDSNLYESLGEWRSTVQMFSRPIARANALHNRVARSIRTGQFPRQLSDELAGAWLMARYGLRPLLNDINSVMDNLESAIGKRRITTRAFGSLTGTASGNGTASTGNGGTLSYTWHASQAVTVRAMTLDDVSWSRANALGFTTKGLVTVPWELMTLSFVADWFANVGDLLGALAPTPGWENLGAALVATDQSACVYTCTGLVSFAPGYYVSQGPTGSASTSLYQKSRGPLTAPGLVVKSNFRLDDPTRLLDALTLLSTRFSRLTAAFRRPDPREMKRRTGRVRLASDFYG